MCMILAQRGLLLGHPFLCLNVEPELSILVSHLMTELPFKVQYLSTLCQSLISIHIRKILQKLPKASVSSSQTPVLTCL